MTLASHKLVTVSQLELSEDTAAEALLILHLGAAPTTLDS